MGNYSSGNYATLPTGDTDLEHVFDATDLTAVSLNDASRVSQEASGEYAIFQFKTTVTGTAPDIIWNGQTSLSPATSPVVLQVYKYAAPAAWETLETYNMATVDEDFTIQR